ncbi:MAG: DUF1571 domain-containing protein [Acidobacteriota bacterium]|nr:DUF1571 domain-containing protein [Acidobacteriota bacterium]
MSKKGKFTILIFLTAISALGFSACRRAEIDDAKNPAANSNEAQSAPMNPPPFAWNELSKRYENVKDYTALYEKEEKAISKGERQTIKLSFRKPFDIRMDWLDDKGKIDQTAIYQKGKNDDKVAAKKGGMLGSMAGTLKLAPDDPLALQDSKHPITEAGLGVLIDRITSVANDPQTKTNYLGEEKTDAGRAAYKVEMSNPNGLNLTGVSNARKAFVWIDKELLLPVKVEIYDANGVLLERHVFSDLKLNANLTDKTFEI